MIFGIGSGGYIPLGGSGGGSPAPPFDPNSADNGLSVDPISGRIVLGNDAGDSLATLLSNREIPLNGFDVAFTKAIGTTFFSGGVNSGIFSDVTSDNFYTAFTAINRSPGTGAITYSGVYNDNLNALFLIATGSNYNQGGSSYDDNVLMLYADSIGPTSDLYIAGDGNIRFLTQGLNRSFEKASLFSSGNFRLAIDGIDDFTATLQVVGQLDNIANFIQNDGQSRAVFGNTGNLIFAPGAAGVVDTGQAIQMQLDGNQPAMHIQDVFGTNVLDIFDGGNMLIGPNTFGDQGARLQIVASGVGQSTLFIGDQFGNSIFELNQAYEWIVTNGFTNYFGPDPASAMVWNGTTQRIEQIGGFTGSQQVDDGLGFIFIMNFEAGILTSITPV